MIAGGLVSLIFAALLAWYFARPIRSLNKAFNDLADGKLATRVGKAMGRRRDELTDLGGDFDRTAERLQALIESQQRLLHDVSHELRSPLARLQAAVELMRQQPLRSSEFIDRIERDCGRMDLLVGELLTLARLDTGATRVQRENAEVIDLADLLSAIVEDAEFEAAGEHGAPCTIQALFASPLPVRGDRELLHRALENVVRNAVRYTRKAQGDACEIKVSARLSADALSGRRQIEVEVADRGPGVPDADLGKIFDPFFRSESTSVEGYGLGLAITLRVVEAHKRDV